MNDYSARIFSYVREAVTEAHKGVFVTSAAFDINEKRLPALLVKFTFPGEDESTIDSSGREVFTRTVCDAEAYSGTSASEARSILATADEAMRRCGFHRTNYTEVPDSDASIRRYAIKWRAKVDRNGNVARW